MELSEIIPHIEALIFASDKPLSNEELAELINSALAFIEDRATQEQVDTAVEGIVEKYSAEFYAFELRQIGGGWQFLTKKEFHKTIAQLNGDKFLKRLSTAALETLAIIAYKQPITKSEIESIRGVNCDYAVQKLLEKDLVIISGRNEDAVGKPLIYATSKSFMDYFGINSSDDLPKISEVLMEELIQATNVKEAEENIKAEDIAEAVIEVENIDAEITIEDTVIEEMLIEETIVTEDYEAIEEEDTTEDEHKALAVSEDDEIIEKENDENKSDEEHEN